MKMFRIVMMVILVLTVSGMALAGCGAQGVESKPASSSESQNNPTSGTTIDTPVEAPAAGSDDAVDEVVKEGVVEKDGNVVLKQLAFTYQGNTIALSDNVDDQKIERLLGKADRIDSHTYSLDDGKNMDQLNGMTEKQYVYPGLAIKTIDATEDKTPFIFSIEITDPKYPTIRNIKVGDSYEMLKEAYPEGNLLGGELSDEADDFRYEPVNYVDAMSFRIKDRKIESILIYTLLD